MNKVINNKLQCGLALTVKESQELYQYIKALEKATERYKPITLQEHDAEPRRFKSILDMETNDIYILKTTKGFAEEYMGMTIEDRNVNVKSEDKK